MTLTHLRIVLLLEVLIMAAAIGTGIQLEGWRGVPAMEIRSSPDAVNSIEGLLLQYAFFSGSYFGMALSIGVVAFALRKQIAKGAMSLRVHWLAIFLLPPVVLTLVVWFGIRPW